MCKITPEHNSILSLAKSTTPEFLQEMGYKLDELASGSPEAREWTAEMNPSVFTLPYQAQECPYEINVTRKVDGGAGPYLFVVLRQMRSPSRSSFVRPGPTQLAKEENPNTLRILVVDDSPMVLKMVSRLIENEGHKVDCKMDGAAALEALKNNHYDAVLMDIHMPHMGGLEASHEFRIHEGLMRQYKGEGSHPHQKLVAMSADFSGTLIHEIMSAGFDGFLAKPITQVAFRELRLKPIARKADL
jgi:CheY-like chemotaxis protein